MRTVVTVCLIFFGVVFLAVGVFGCVAPEGILDIANMSQQEEQCRAIEYVPYFECYYVTVYDVDPSLVRGIGAGLGVVGLALTIPGIVRVVRK